MLNEICADLAVVKTLTQTAESEVEVGKYGSISFLDDELIEEGEAARERVLIRERGQAPLPDLFYLECGSDAFEIDTGGVTGRV